jgi:hypothetical protein
MVCEEPDSPTVLRVHCEFLCVLRLIHCVSGVLVHGVRGRSTLEWRMVHFRADGPQVHHRWSVFHGASLAVQGAI